MSQKYAQKLEAQRLEEAGLLVRVVFARDADALRTLLNYALWEEDYDIHVQDGVEKGVQNAGKSDAAQRRRARGSSGPCGQGG